VPLATAPKRPDFTKNNDTPEFPASINSLGRRRMKGRSGKTEVRRQCRRANLDCLRPAHSAPFRKATPPRGPPGPPDDPLSCCSTSRTDGSTEQKPQVRAFDRAAWPPNKRFLLGTIPDECGHVLTRPSSSTGHCRGLDDTPDTSSSDRGRTLEGAMRLTEPAEQKRHDVLAKEEFGASTPLSARTGAYLPRDGLFFLAGSSAIGRLPGSVARGLRPGQPTPLFVLHPGLYMIFPARAGHALVGRQGAPPETDECPVAVRSGMPAWCSQTVCRDDCRRVGLAMTATMWVRSTWLGKSPDNAPSH